MTKPGPFIFGQKSDSNRELQERLKSLGAYTGEVDGIFGRQTADAITKIQVANGFPASGRVDGEVIMVLFPNGIATPSKEKAKVNSNWLSGLVATTAFKYLLAMAATWVASRTGIEQARIEAIVIQAIGFAAAAWGMWESAKSKIVVDGQKVDFKDMPTADKVVATEIVAANKAA